MTSRRLRKAALVVLLPAMLALAGCQTLLGGVDSPEDAFLYAEALYRDALQLAVSYSDQCVAAPNVECATTVQKLDDVNTKAQGVILSGQLIMDGFVAPEMICDEVADPGCTQRLKDQRLLDLAAQLQQAAAVITGIGGQ